MSWDPYQYKGRGGLSILVASSNISLVVDVEKLEPEDMPLPPDIDTGPPPIIVPPPGDDGGGVGTAPPPSVVPPPPDDTGGVNRTPPPVVIVPPPPMGDPNTAPPPIPVPDGEDDTGLFGDPIPVPMDEEEDPGNIGPPIITPPPPSDGPSNSGPPIVLANLPTAENTGVVDEAALEPYTGPLNINEPTVIENKIIEGQINVRAPLTMRNCRHDANGSLYCVFYSDVQDNHGLVIEDCEFSGSRSAALLFHEGVMRRIHTFNTGSDAMKIQGTKGLVRIEDSYMERIGYVPNSNDPDNPSALHSDGIQTRRDVLGMTLRNVNMDFHGHGDQYVPNGALIIQSAEGPIDGPIRYIGCRFGGGSIVVRHTLPNNSLHTPPSDVVFENCVFPTGEWIFGPSDQDGSGVTYVGCTDEFGVNRDMELSSGQAWT